MAQPLSIEDSEWTYLITTRTADSRLWFVNNNHLEQRILAALARYQQIHAVTLYAFVIMGNHYHILARFPKRNRALFMRDFNSAVARLVGRHVSTHGRRSVWARRYGYQVLLREEDIAHWFYYVALNPVSSGIVSSASQYPSYNSFFDTASEITRSYGWINWSKYLLNKRHHPKSQPEEFSKRYPLVFSRLPGYAAHSHTDYARVLTDELTSRQASLVSERKVSGKGFLGLNKYKAQAPGVRPRHTKTSTRYSIRPLILTLCSKTRKKFLKLYFSIRDAFQEASAAFCAGNLAVTFPDGTYPPPRLVLT
jgi:REP element-mobilizing transposase RayT